MERSDLDADFAAADQELSALLEKHINAPMRRSIEEVSGSLSFTLKGDFDSTVLSLRSELKKLSSAFEEFGDELASVRQTSKRIETLIQQTESAQNGRFEKAGAQLVESYSLVTKGIGSVEERLSQLGAAKLDQLKALAADVQNYSSESHDAQQKSFSKLDSIASRIAAQEAQTLSIQSLSKIRFVWLCAAFSLNFGALVALLVTAFL